MVSLARQAPALVRFQSCLQISVLVARYVDRTVLPDEVGALTITERPASMCVSTRFCQSSSTNLPRCTSERGGRRSYIWVSWKATSEDGFSEMRFLSAREIDGMELRDVEMLEHRRDSLASALYLADVATLHLDRERGELTLRFALWGLGAGCAGTGTLVGMAAGAILGRPPLQIPWVVALCSAMGFVAALAMWPAFAPPAAYTRWVRSGDPVAETQATAAS